MATHPEQHKAAAAPAPYDAPPPPQPMEVGGSGTAKVSFADVNGTNVPIASSTWTPTGPLTVTPNAADPTSASFVATGPGRASIRVDVVSQSGAPAEAATDIMVIETGTPSVGTLTLTIQAAKKAK